MITHENTLSERERFVLSALALENDALTARRAQALLEWAAGESRDKIAQSTGLRPAQVQYLTRSFSQKRLEVFSPSSVERAGRGMSGCITVEQLLRDHPTDLSHARYVEGLSSSIFDQTAGVHQLDPTWRRLIGLGALLHNIGAAEHNDGQQQAGRDLIIAHDLEGISGVQRDIIACLVLFQRRKPKFSRDPIFAALDQQSQHATLALASILRVADALDYTQSQTTSIVSIKVNALTDVIVEGPNAEADAARANKRADMWRDVLSPPFHARLANQTLPSYLPSLRPRLKTDVRSLEPITRAGKKIISAQFAKVRSLEDAVRAGGNVEAVHDIRVATRRMRSAFRLLNNYYPRKPLRKLRKPIREMAAYLGQVRDLDVLIENLRAYAATLTVERQRALDPLVADWQARRAQAHRSLVEFLDSPEYDDWVGRIEDFIETKDPTDNPRVADVVPGLIWKRYGKVREYERRAKQASLATLHELRIENKRLRYALEFFAEATGEQTALLLEPLIALQDHLGELHDADMATQLIAEFIAAKARHAQRQGLAGTDFEAVAGYLSVLRSRIVDLQSGFPDRWQILTKAPFRQALADVVAAL